VKFGSQYKLSEEFIKKVLKSGVVETILMVAEAKDQAKMARDLGPGKKKDKIIGIPKLEDANKAGTKHA
jgi:DNA topoisomerase-2